MSFVWRRGLMSRSLDIAGACDRVGRELQLQYDPEPIPAAVLIEAVVAACGCKPGSVLPADRCYNRTNNGIPWKNSPVFICEGRGLFRHVGPNYPYTGPVYHKPTGEPERIVGQRIEGRLVNAQS
jgi:hypothetical protein